VGPNGCGKSNVADALTWVLGEQSAKSLRGDKMEDVIFSGSDARKPTGAAEVRLRLSDVIVPPSLLKELGESNGNGYHADSPGENGNGHLPGADGVTRDVEVTRRLFRSGESEYLIDGQICRLRDIHELLMDTGLGAKAYAIIEQGKIGMILSSRPTDRRQLIEEAAGISRFRVKREEAARRLERVQQNLLRLGDIVDGCVLGLHAQGQQRQPPVDGKHEGDGHRSSHDRIQRVHDSRTQQHAHVAEIVGNPRHQLARLVSLIKRHRERFEVGKHIRAERIFHVAGSSDKPPAGGEPANPLEKCQGNQYPGVLEKLALGHRRIQPIHGSPHYPWAHHLKGVRENYGEKSDGKSPPVPPQIGIETGQDTPLRCALAGHGLIVD
jgi:energy-coupling factor transporter ATP-binding protein EcfA2